MNQPPLDDLLSRVDSKYTLVVVAAKRARQLTEQKVVAESKATKPVTIALREIAQGKTSYERLHPWYK